MKKGGELERTLEAVHQVYLMTRRAKLHKVDPPVRIVRQGRHSRVIFLENPFLDYIGVWTEQGARMLAVEAKQTEEPRLQLSDSKLSANQSNALSAWERFGTVSIVCWRFEGEIRIVTRAIINAEMNAGRASVRWKRAVPLVRSDVPNDYLHTVNRLGI